MTSTDPIPSPCRHVCRIDSAREICEGCGRTPQEIVEWIRLLDDERRTVAARAEERLGRGAAR